MAASFVRCRKREEERGGGDSSVMMCWPPPVEILYAGCEIALRGRGTTPCGHSGSRVCVCVLRPWSLIRRRQGSHRGSRSMQAVARPEPPRLCRLLSRTQGHTHRACSLNDVRDRALVGGGCNIFPDELIDSLHPVSFDTTGVEKCRGRAPERLAGEPRPHLT